MANYEYKGKGEAGIVTGVLAANSESLAADALLRRNIVPIEIKLQATVSSGNKSSFREVKWYTPQVTIEDLSMFCRQMFALTKAGIPIMRAIRGLAETTTCLRLRVALLDVVMDLEKGRALSSALASHPKLFSRLFVSLINVGENTGNLEGTFLQLADYYEREQETRKRIVSAMRYPLFVMFAIAAALVVMNIFVIPTFAQMFAKFGAELPITTRILLASSELFIHYWWLMLIVLIVTIFSIRRYVNTARGRLKWDKLKLKLPIVGSIIERSTLARFARSYAVMLASGVPIIQGLTLVSESVDNTYMGQKINDMRRGIERGDSMLRTANASEMFTPLILQMFAVGEETGQVEQMLTEVAEYYEREVDFDLKSLTAKLEPILIVIVAAMVLILALGIFTPMWDMMNVYKGRS